MSSTELNGIPDKVQKTEQIFIWFIQSVWRGTWFRRLVFLLILFLTFASPLSVTPASSHWGVQIPTWYNRSYWIAAGLLVLLTLIVGFRTVPRLPRMAAPRIDVHAARGLVPFNLEDGELFAQLERGIMLQRVLAALSDPNFRFGILSGLSGTGKTSFLRAGLLAQLRKSNVPTAYVELSNDDPLVTIQRELERQGLTTIKGVLLLDQFEQFFLHQRTEEQRKPLADALLRWYQRDSGVRVLISIRAEDLLAMKEIQETVDYQLSNQNFFKLSKFSAEQAVRVLQVLCENAGISFDPAFAPKIVHTQLQDREDSLVSPVNLGILMHVLTSTQNGHALTSETIKAYGGIDGILEDWLNSQLETARLQGLEKAVIRTLSALCDFDHNRRSGTLTAEAITTKLAGDFSGREIDRALQWLERPDVRLVVRIYHGDAKSLSYQLTHERLIPAIRKTAGKLLDDAARANELLDRRVGEWVSNERSSRFLLPLFEYLKVEHQRPYLIWGEARADKEALLKRSRTQWQQRAAVSALSMLLLPASYSVWSSNIAQRRYIEWRLAHHQGSAPWVGVAEALAAIGDWPGAKEAADRMERGDSARPFALEEIAVEMAKTGLANKDQNLLVQARHEAEALDKFHRSDALVGIAVEMIAAGDASKAKELLEQARQDAEKLDPPDRSRRLWKIAAAVAKAGDTGRARELLEQARQESEKLNAQAAYYLLDVRSEALLDVAVEIAKGGDASNAKAMLEQARQVAQELKPGGNSVEKRDRRERVQKIIKEMARLGLVNNDPELLEQARDEADKLDSADRSIALWGIAVEMTKTGLANKDQNLLVQARREAETLDQFYRLGALVDIAVEMAKAGETNKATELLKQARQEAEKLDSGFRYGDLLHIAAEMRKLGDAKGAEELLQQARQDAEKDPLPVSAAWIAVEMAKLGDAQSAKEVLGRAQRAVERLRPEKRPAALLNIAKDAAEAGDVSMARVLLEQARLASDNLVSRDRTKVLPEIAAEMARLGYLKRAREIADGAGGPWEIADALVAVIRADTEVSRSPHR